VAVADLPDGVRDLVRSGAISRVEVDFVFTLREVVEDNRPAPQRHSASFTVMDTIELRAGPKAPHEYRCQYGTGNRREGHDHEDN
jgi:hypothetical protein